MELLECAASFEIKGLSQTLEIADFPDQGGRGLAVTRDVEQGEVILDVPFSALIGVHCAREDHDFGKMAVNYAHLSSVEVLTAYLLNEVSKSHSSRWFSYLRHLPRAHHNLAHFSAEETQALQVEEAISAAKLSVETTHEQWTRTSPLLSCLRLQRKFITFKAWLWASATISSRTLHVPWDDAGVLCPIGDLFNYEAPIERILSSSVTDCNRLTDGGYDDSTRSYRFYARKNYQKGQQALICYGQYTNLELLEHYGFLLPQNPCDVVYIPAPSPEDFGFKNNADTSVKGKRYAIEADGRPSFLLLQQLRLCAVPACIRKSNGYLAIQGLAISRESDGRAFAWLQRTCRDLLDKLPTTIDQDLRNLQQLADEDERYKLAIQWRLGYKTILGRCLTYSQAEVDDQ